MSTSVSLSVTAVPSVNLRYTSSSYCQSDTSVQSATLNGTGLYTGGVFSSTPSGLSLNSSNGSITPNTSVTGNYVVDYNLGAAGGCNAISASTTITINTVATATVTAGSAICSGNTASFTINGTPNATVTYNINSGTNTTVVLSSTGTYLISIPNSTTNRILTLVSVTDGICPATLSSSATVTVNPLPLISGLTNPVICSGASVNYTLPSTISSSPVSHSWYALDNVNTNGETLSPAQTTYLINDQISHSQPTTLPKFTTNNDCEY